MVLSASSRPRDYYHNPGHGRGCAPGARRQLISDKFFATDQMFVIGVGGRAAVPDTGNWNTIAAGITDQQGPWPSSRPRSASRAPRSRRGPLGRSFRQFTMSEPIGLGRGDDGRSPTGPSPGQKTRQPIGALEGHGRRGRASCSTATWIPGVEMSGWSVDPYGAKFEDGWGCGGMGGGTTTRGGVGGPRSVRSEAIVRSGGVRPCAGDVPWSPPVVAHQAGRRRAPRAAHGQGAARRPLRSTWSTPPKHDRQRSCVGIVMVRIKTKSPRALLPVTAGRPGRKYMNPIEGRQAEIIRRIGPSLDPIKPRRLAALHAASRPAGVPDAHLRHDAQGSTTTRKSYTGMSQPARCEMIFQLRTVARPDARDRLREGRGGNSSPPNQEGPPRGSTRERDDDPPPMGWRDGWFPGTRWRPRPDHRLVTRRSPKASASPPGTPAVVGGWGRLGNVGRRQTS